MSPHATSIAVVSGSVTGAVAISDLYGRTGTILQWLWLQLGFEPMPLVVAASIVIALLTVVFSAIGFWMFKGKE